MHRHVHFAMCLHNIIMQVGYVVMPSVSEATAALKLCVSGTALPCCLSDIGLRSWSGQYTGARPTVTTLESVATGVVTSYDHQHQEKFKERKAGQPDEEGWITVTRKRRSTQVYTYS